MCPLLNLYLSIVPLPNLSKRTTLNTNWTLHTTLNLRIHGVIPSFPKNLLRPRPRRHCPESKPHSHQPQRPRCKRPLEETSRLDNFRGAPLLEKPARKTIANGRTLDTKIRYCWLCHKGFARNEAESERRYILYIAMKREPEVVPTGTVRPPVLTNLYGWLPSCDTALVCCSRGPLYQHAGSHVDNIPNPKPSRCCTGHDTTPSIL